MLALLVAGCSLGGTLESDQAAAPEPETDYGKLVADGFATQLAGPQPQATLEVSPLHRTQPVQPGDWFACVRRTSDKEAALFAVFFRDHKIDSVRRAVIIDKCGGDTYVPLPPPNTMATAKPADAHAGAKPGAPGAGSK